MDRRTKKTKEEKKENLYPVGFLQNLKKITGYFTNEENADQLLASSKKTSKNPFSKKHDIIVIQNKSNKTALKAAQIDALTSSKIKSKEILTFVYGKDANKKTLWASQKKDHTWKVEGTLPHAKGPTGIVADYLHNKKYVAYFGDTTIQIAFSTNLKHWIKEKEPVLRSRPGFFDHGRLQFIATRHSKRGILVFYDASERQGENMLVQIGVALFSLTNPEKIIWRSDVPVFQEKVHYDKDMKCKGTVFVDGIVSFYWYSKGGGLVSASVVEPFAHNKYEIQKLERHAENPIMKPKESWWRSEATLNPAAINIDGTVHLLFRAMGSDGISRIGYAKSENGFHITEISDEPVFFLNYPYIGKKTKKKRYDPILYPSGGSWGGCEDPRIVLIGDTIYMTFNSFDGWDNMRVGLTSIALADFLNKKWDWEKPQLISPGRAKNWMLFPEKIHGKFALLHNIHGETANHVRVEYLDSLEDIESKHMQFESPNPQAMPQTPIAWHMHMRSATTPPIKTPDGWLVFYHAHHADEMNRYKLGAMLLDLDDPTKVIARAATPVLVPDMWYENEGKPGIVYASGAIIKDDTLFIYYGGGDKHVCVATVPFHAFMASLKSQTQQMPRIEPVIVS